MLNFDDDDVVVSNPIDREPEREPDQSFQEGNITQTKLENEKGILGKTKNI